MNSRRLPWLASVLLLLGACATTDPMMMVTPAYSEAEIAAVNTAVHEGEIQQGQAASTRATSPEVRSFAQMMVTDHTAARENAQQVFARNNITPADNNISNALRTNSQQTVTNLATYSGTAFDRAYMRTQVDLHQWVLSGLDESLIPSARTPEMRTLLQNQRASVAAHLEQARAILGRL